MLAEQTPALQVIILIAYVAVMIVLAVALYRLGRRRASAAWWIAAVGGALALVLLPFVGLVGAGMVLFADRKSTAIGRKSMVG